VTWAERALVRGYVIATGRRARWRLPTPPGSSVLGVGVSHTVNRVFFSLSLSPPGPARQAWAARWPSP
jgi:hypothetical protein